MSAVDQNKERKKKQLVLGGTALGLITMVGLGSMFMLDSEEAQSPEGESQAVALQDVGGIDNQDSWRRTMGEQEEERGMQLADLERRLADQTQTNEQMLLELNAMNQRINETQNQPPQVIEKVTRVEVPVPSRSNNSSAYGSSSQGSYNTSSGSVLPNPNQANSSPSGSSGGYSEAIANYANANNGDGLAQQPTQAQPREVEVISFDIPQKSSKSTVPAGTGSKNGNKNSTASFIPATSFVAGTLLNGLDAPTGGQGQSNPLPIVLHVNNLANLPNNRKANIKDCRFLGAAWGDLSSERMMARIESLSCIINGVSYEMPAKGYIIGEDGKSGMRGRLVSKKGKSIGLSFLAGVVGATGSAVQQSAGSTTSLGGLTSTRIDGGEVARAGLGGGVGKAGSALSDYYVRQAEMLFDVIEIDAGRRPEVLVTSSIQFPDGVELKGNSKVTTARPKRRLTDD